MGPARKVASAVSDGDSPDARLQSWSVCENFDKSRIGRKTVLDDACVFSVPIFVKMETPLPRPGEPLQNGCGI